jgi:hypothetical protein
MPLFADRERETNNLKALHRLLFSRCLLRYSMSRYCDAYEKKEQENHIEEYADVLHVLSVFCAPSKNKQ